MGAPEIAVIGAGISGLSCARLLQEAGARVVVLEKSRSLGGRCATRKWEGHIVDHGAQYFTIRDEDFRAELTHRCGEFLRTIGAPFMDAAGAAVPLQTPAFYHAQGNNRLGKALAQNLNVRLEMPAADAQWSGGKWLVCNIPFDAVISSAPLPQSLALIGRAAEVETYAPCLTAFFSYQGQGAGNSADCYARTDRAGALAWSACENQKAGRVLGDQSVFVTQASPDFSAQCFDQEPAMWAAALQDLLEERWDLPKSARLCSFTHRWRYARYLHNGDAQNLPPGFFITGDCRSDSRVEAAWLAGRATARQVLLELSVR